MNLSSRVVRYARAWSVGPDDVLEEEITIDRDGTPIPATVVRPRGMPAPLPSWVVLHGITRPGRAHAQLVRFTRSVASAGLATIVPEVPEWRELSLAPHLTVPTVAAAVRGLRETGFVRGDRLGLVGFSFGAPHAIAASGDPRLRDDIAGVCGFGGYSSIEHTIRFMMDGHHGWGGREHHLRPDPYGRWIVAANYLTSVPDHADAADVADALRVLAKHAGDVGAASWDPIYDGKIRELRSSVAEERRPLFDAFAVESGKERKAGSEPSHAELAEALVAGARRRDPGIDPVEGFARVTGEVHILHGRRDHLIPFTEGYRMAEALSHAEPRLTVTRLFGHSSQERFPFWSALTEVPRFARALSDVLTVV
ncbi:MAG: hypothetical protein R3253_04055 [Longimicrobiales bacterium]|nr:hypothetical protein [Longimicrobiales bacterium]